MLKRSFLELHKERQEMISTMGLLLRITDTITSSRGDEVEDLNRILELVLEETGFENASILVYHREEDALVLKAARGFLELMDAPFSFNYNRELVFRRGEGIAWQVFESHVPVFISDFRTHSQKVSISSSVEIGCLAVLPLLNLGVLNLSRSEPCHFSAQRKRDLVIVARVVAAILHSGDIGDKLEESHRQIQQLVELEGTTSHGLMDRVVNTIPQAICFLDKEKRISDVNNGFLEMFGCGREGVIGRSPLLFFQEGADFLWLENALKRGKMGKLVDITLKRLDGTSFPADLFLHTLGDKGEPTSYMLVIHDLTGQKLKAESVLRSEKLKALGAMAGGIAHDFNNVLTSIQGNIELIKGRIRDQELLKRIEAIETAVEDGAYTVRRLQIFRGKDEPLPARHCTSLVDALADAVELTRPRWKDEMEKEGHTISLVMQCARGLAAAIQPSAMREVLVNLIFNACDAMPQGGTLILRCSQEGDRVKVEVEDTGCGMTPEVQQRIFDPFYTTKDVGNSGLGLSMCYSLITRAGGEIHVASEPGKGTCFTILLPAASSPEVEGGDKPLEPEGPLRILAVDDDPQITGLLRDLLEARGHHVELAQSGEEALEKLSSGRFHMVLTDLGMPGMNGWVVAEKVKELSPETKVMLLTGWGADFEGKDLTDRCVDGVLCKPFRSVDLLTAMARVLRGETDGAGC